MALKTIAIRGNSYVTVNERLKYFRENFKGYALVTELVDVNDKTALIRATVVDPEGKLVATGTSFERADNKRSLVNATSHVENCETSAWGRALGNFGIGIDTSVCSADEVEHVKEKPAYQEKPEKKTTDKTTVMEAITACKTVERVETLWKRAMAYYWTPAELKDLEECKANVLAKVEEQRKSKVAEQVGELVGDPSLAA